jgi:hypothetical protein
MTRSALSPSQCKKLRQLASLAFEREMIRELDTLERAFHRWRAGDLTVPDLLDTLQAFHEGPHRKLSVLCFEGDPLPAVARAVALGFLQNHEVGADLIKNMKKQIEFFRP